MEYTQEELKILSKATWDIVKNGSPIKEVKDIEEIYKGKGLDPLKEISSMLDKGDGLMLKRALASEHHNTSAEVLTILSRDEEWGIRYLVTENPNTPKEIVKTMDKEFPPCPAFIKMLLWPFKENK